MRFCKSQRFLAPLLLLACFVLAWRPLEAEDDFWAHAAVGRWIVEHGGVPATGLFLWGSEPTPWVAHSWLTQTIFYALLQAGGGWTPRGALSEGNGPLLVIVVTTTVITIIFAMLWRIWSRRAKAGTLAMFLFVVAFFLSALRFHPRPELFSALFLTILLNFLLLWRAEISTDVTDTHAPQDDKTSTRLTMIRDWGASIGVIGMFALWANTHGAVAIGVMLLFLTALGDLVQFRGDTKARRLAMVSAGCLAATALNPYGFARYWKAILTSSQSATFGQIVEWQPPLSVAEMRSFLSDGVQPPLILHVLAFILLAFCGCLLWRANRQRRWAEMLWVMLLALLFLQQRRHMWLAAIVCLAVLAHNISCLNMRPLLAIWNKRAGREPQTALPAPYRALAVLAAYLAAIVFATRFTPSNIWQIVSSRPDAACYALQQHFRKQREVRVFSDYETSSYLQWWFNSGTGIGNRVLDAERTHFPLFIDLLNAYPDVVTRQYIAIMKGDEKLLRKRGAQAVMLTATRRDDPLAKKLNASLEWRLIYSSNDSDVWVFDDYRYVSQTICSGFL